MSVVDRMDRKVTLPRVGCDPFWQRLLDAASAAGDLDMKYLAMLALRENSGWPLAAIGRVFGHPKGHVSRVLKQTKAAIAARYQLRPDGQVVDRDEAT